MAESVELFEILAALSLATDLANDQPFESALRTTILATELARRAGGDRLQVTDVAYAAILRFIGCTAWSSEAAALMDGDDLAFHTTFAAVDSRRVRDLYAAVRSRTRGRSVPEGARVFATVSSELPSALSEFAASSCEIAQRLTTRLGMTTQVIEALSQTYERWDGRGRPLGLSGEKISWIARVIQVARLTELLPRMLGCDAALATLRRRAGGQIDPSLVDVVLRDPTLLLAASGSVWDALPKLVGDAAYRPTAGLEDAARAFGDFVDLKSVYTLGHSSAVSELAESAACQLGLSDAECKDLRIAGLLHDLGRVAVPTGIWDKEGPLNGAEWERVRLHAYYGERVLSCSKAGALPRLAAIVGAHHERLDGAGYHRGTPASLQLTSARVLAAADVYQSLRERRPHRDAFTPDEAARTLEAESAAGRLDVRAVHTVLAAAGHARRSVPVENPARLSEREIEVLKWIAQGRTNKEAAHILSISPRTVQHHVEHIYAKIGVSTRAGAALFAIEHGLLAS